MLNDKDKKLFEKLSYEYQDAIIYATEDEPKFMTKSGFEQALQEDREQRDNVITIDLIMLNTVKKCQKVLAKWIVPDSKISDADCLNKLLEIVDDQSLVKYMNTIESSLISSKEGV